MIFRNKELKHLENPHSLMPSNTCQAGRNCPPNATPGNRSGSSSWWGSLPDPPGFNSTEGLKPLGGGSGGSSCDSWGSHQGHAGLSLHRVLQSPAQTLQPPPTCKLI